MMGQHKHNPTALAAARKELPPKPPKKSKRQLDAEMRTEILTAMEERAPGLLTIIGMMGGDRYV